VILLVLLLALIIRFICINQSLWWDEAINIVYAKSNSLWWFVTKYPIGDFHPPGWFAILWIWGHIFGFSEISARFPSVFFGVSTVFLIYLIGKNLFSKKTGLLAAFFLSLGPLHIYYSQEARMYSMAAFAVCLSIFFLIELTKGKRFAFWGYIFSVFLILYSDYVAYFILPAEVIYILLYGKKYFKRYFLALIAGMATLVPWLFVLPSQLAKGQYMAGLVTGWKQVVGGANIKEVALLLVKTIIGRISFNKTSFYVVFVLILSLPYLIILSKLFKKRTKKNNLLLLFLLIPPILAFGFSFMTPIFFYFRLIFILPIFYLLLAVNVVEFKPLWTRILVGLVLFGEIVSSSIYFLNPAFQRENWRGAINSIEKNVTGNSLALFEYDEIPSTFAYYTNWRLAPKPGLKKIPVKSANDLNDLDELKSKNEVYLFEYLADVTDPERLLEKKLQLLGFYKTQIYNFDGVGFISLYKRD
jgi:4-amino-4-deoxy-L-arabinose transferase-like glycosyltransferase